MIDRRFHFLLMALAVCCQLSFAAAPTTQPFGPYTERVKGTLVKFDMVPIPAGKMDFSIDNQGPPVAVEIKRFWIAKTECTWNDFEAFYMQKDLDERERFVRREPRTRPSLPYMDPHWEFGGDGYPAITMTAHSATMYCRWLSEKTGRKYRLPTEAEWEYACRAGAAGELNRNQLDDVAWHEGNSKETTHPVMQKKPNAWGLYDMLGNAGEWCTPMEGKLPVLRGGSYASKPADVRCTARAPFDPAWQIRDPDDPKSRWWLCDAPFTGFRVVTEE
jgi:formylglycine-generating enzyme required for sulfatase activity